MNYPPHLIEAFKKLTDDFETAIRADERDRIISKMRGNLFTEQTSQPVQESGPLFPITGMHGEPLQESGPQPVEYHPAEPFDYVKLGLNETHRRMLSYLREGFMAVPTLAGHCNIKKQSVYTYLCQLEEMGYKIERKNTGNRRGGYRLIYRLAKSA
jgi:biotin operon repressor